METKPVTRIDLEQAGQGQVIIKKYFQGWGKTSCFDMMEFEIGTSIPALLKKYEDEGFTVEMASPALGRALRGRTTRVDIIQEGDSWVISKFPFGWTAKTRPISKKTVTEQDAQEAVRWLNEHGWTVYSWDGGYRAWKGTPMPVRDSRETRYLRNKSDSEMSNGEHNPYFHYDLLFYF
jgi:hypothetical protein